MTKIVKRDGALEVFQYAKVAGSLRRAGATQDIIDRTLQRVTPVDGESTASFRGRITDELFRRAPEAARRYQLSRGLKTSRLNAPAVQLYGWYGRNRSRPMRTA